MEERYPRIIWIDPQKHIVSFHYVKGWEREMIRDEAEFLALARRIVEERMVIQ